MSDRPNYLRRLFAGAYSPKTTGRGPLSRMEEALPGSSAYYLLPFWPLLEPTPIEVLSEEQRKLCAWLMHRLEHLKFRFGDPCEVRMWPDLSPELESQNPELVLAFMCGIYRVGCRNGVHTSVRCDLRAKEAFNECCRLVANYEPFVPHRREFLDYMTTRFLPRTRGLYMYDSSKPDQHYEPGLVLAEFLASMAR